jgi:hypothetical protein
MLRRSLLTVATLALLSTAIGHADQCQILDDATVPWATRALRKGDMVIRYCAPCGDKAPGTPFKIDRVEAKGKEILVNGKAVDLAYIYVQTGPTNYANVGLLVGCDAAGVEPFLDTAKKALDASCEAVSRHIIDIMLADKNIPDEAKKNKDALVKMMIEECVKSSPPQAQMECAMRAKNLAELEKCDKE